MFDLGDPRLFEHTSAGLAFDDHVCCEHAEEAWNIVCEFQRRLLIIDNAVRGT